jgi:hypothetical protein
MTYAAPLSQANPSKPYGDVNALVECIQACFDCAQACTWLIMSETPTAVSACTR